MYLGTYTWWRQPGEIQSEHQNEKEKHGDGVRWAGLSISKTADLLELSPHNHLQTRSSEDLIKP